MRQFSWWIKPVLFLSSYTPLYLMGALRFWNTGPMLTPIYRIPRVGIPVGFSWLTGTLTLLAVASTATLYWIIGFHSDRGTKQHPVDEYKKRHELLSSYLLVYVFTFAGLEFPGLLDSVLFLLFFLVLGILQIRSGHLHVNPMLGIRGYQMYELTTDKQVVLVVSNGPLEEKVMSPEIRASSDASDKVSLVSLGPAAYLAPKHDSQNQSD